MVCCVRLSEWVSRSWMSLMIAEFWCKRGFVFGTLARLLMSISSCLGILLGLLGVVLFGVVHKMSLGIHFWMRSWQHW